jgi:hypothetical protein
LPSKLKATAANGSGMSPAGSHRRLGASVWGAAGPASDNATGKTAIDSDSSAAAVEENQAADNAANSATFTEVHGNRIR